VRIQLVVATVPLLEVVVMKWGPPWLPGEVRAGFWNGVRSRRRLGEAVAAARVSLSQAQRWFREAGGVPPGGAVAGSGRYLSLVEREEIALGLAQKLAYREIARRLGRPVSTASPGGRRNDTRGRYRYRAVAAQALRSGRRGRSRRGSR
jgi:IS30 family transposase